MRASKTASVEAHSWELSLRQRSSRELPGSFSTPSIQIHTARDYADIFSSEGPAELWVWMQSVNGIAYTVFLVALGSYILLWLRFRQRSDLNE